MVTNGHEKDTERYGLMLGTVIFIICFSFIVSRAVFLHCAILFLVMGKLYFSQLSGAVKVYSPERTNNVYE